MTDFDFWQIVGMVMAFWGLAMISTELLQWALLVVGSLLLIGATYAEIQAKNSA